MKKLKFSGLLLASALLFSCSSDDDNGSASIVGKWAFVDTVVDGVSEPYDDHEDCGKDYVEFKADNTYVSVDVWGCEEDVDDYGTYSLNGNKLTINGMTNDVTITNTRLSIIAMEDYDDDGTLEEVILNLERL